MGGKLLPGMVFAGYVIEHVLGSGGMGTVYAARHPRLPRRDALKVLSEGDSADPEFRARFIREAEMAAQLDHPNIVGVHDTGVADGNLWISMQLVHGIDAAELIRRNPAGVAPAQALHILAGAARGLDAAHRAGLLHRDVKPGNLLLELRDGRPSRILVADFGIARIIGQRTTLTEAGTVLATLAYAAPEQLMAGRVDHRADVYALGCTFFELLTGVKAFPRANPTAVLQAHLQEPPPRVTMRKPELPRAIDEVIAVAMAKDPAHRYPTCGALADAAAAALGMATGPRPMVAAPAARPIEPWPGPGSVPAPARSRRIPFAIAAGVLTVIIALAAAGVVALTRHSSAQRSAIPATTSPAAPAKPSSSAVADDAQAWGNSAYMVRALPRLLPPTPVSSGYQGVRCVPTDQDRRAIDVNAPSQSIGRLLCNGNRNPVETMFLTCNANRSPAFIRPFPEMTEVREERWERPTGRGRVITGNLPDDGGTRSGVLLLSFDDPARNFCLLSVYTDGAGQDLYDRWWLGAPL